MSALTGPSATVDHRDGNITPVAMASAVQVYKGGAAAVVHGTGYGTPLVPSTAGHDFIGVWGETILSVAPAGTTFTTILRSGVWRFDSSGLTAANLEQKLYFSDDHTVTTTPGTTFAGILVAIDAAGGAWVDIESAVSASPLVNVLNIIAAGTALSATVTETALGAKTIPANTLKAGDIIKVRFQGIATATNSTDTLAVKLYIGGLAGTVLISMAATDVANNDVFSGEYEIVVRTSGASGTIVGVGTYKSIPAAEGTMTIKDDILASTALDTTAAVDMTVSGTWSTNNAGNSCRLDILNVTITRS